MNRWIKRSLLLMSIATTVLMAEDTTFTSYHFSGSGNCSMCHNGLTDAEGKDVSIETAWSSTMMANAAKDPLWPAGGAQHTRLRHLPPATGANRRKQHSRRPAERLTREARDSIGLDLLQRIGHLTETPAPP